MRFPFLPVVVLACLPTLFGCTDDSASSAASQKAVAEAAIAAAIANPERPAADQERDASRRPDAVLSFFEIRPGLRVLELYSGGCYYAELLAHVVGPEGKVVAHNNQAYVSYVQDELANRFRDDRLANVEPLLAENNELDLPAESFDAVLLILGFHDFYYVDEDNGWPRIDVAGTLGQVHQALRPGGTFGVVDHAAAPGSSSDSGNTLHRIDPAIAIREIEAAGFTLEERSDVLHNPDDDHSLPMSDPAIRGQTDRFVLRFRKK